MSLQGHEFPVLHVVQTASGAYPAYYPMGMGTKQPGHEADHSPSSSAEVNKTWIYISIPPIRLHSVVLSKLSTEIAFLTLSISMSSRLVLDQVYLLFTYYFRPRWDYMSVQCLAT
jgi:hypothetical protein